MNHAFRIIIPTDSKDIESYYKLRFEVLRKPWGQEEKTVRDEWEDQSLHALMIDEKGKAIATGRLQFNSNEEAQVRSMAVADEYRNKGLGTLMLQFLEKEAKDKGYSSIILDARDNAVNFYKNNGYEIIGDSYKLFDVIPHFRMKKFF